MYYESINKLSNSIENLREKYVPGMGNCNTVGGEIIRALDRIVYRFYNDGDMVGEGYGIETCNSSYRYLYNHVPNCPDLTLNSSEQAYELSLADIVEYVVKYIQKHSELFEKENLEDSREVSDEDREDLRSWEREDDEWDEDEYDICEYDIMW